MIVEVVTATFKPLGYLVAVLNVHFRTVSPTCHFLQKKLKYLNTSAISTPAGTTVQLRHLLPLVSINSTRTCDCDKLNQFDTSTQTGGDRSINFDSVLAGIYIEKYSSLLLHTQFI